MKSNTLHDAPASVRLKIASLWVSVMFCYVYGDYFDLYRPGTLHGMLQGRMPPLGAVLIAPSPTDGCYIDFLRWPRQDETCNRP